MSTVIYLLEQGAELFNANAQDSENPFFHAAVNGHVEMAKFLAKKDPTLFKNSDPQKILMLAACNNHVEIIQYLLSEGVQPAVVEHPPRNYVNPLTIAVQNGCVELVKILLAYNPINNNINYLLSPALTKKNHAMVTVLLEHYFAQAASTEILVDKLKGLEETFYQSALSYCKLSHKNLITQPSWLISSFQQLPTKQFKAFFISAVQLGIFSIDEVVVAANSKSKIKKENFEKNQTFIINEVAPFTPYRKEIETLIAKLNTKSQELKWHASRSHAIADLASTLQKEVNQFFTQPSHANSEILFHQCKAAVEAGRDGFVNSPRTSFEWRIINKILLIVAHIFVITIPLIWLHPASRNLLLDKTDSQAKAEDALESIRQFNQLVMEKKFDRFFHPVQREISDSEKPLDEHKIFSNHYSSFHNNQ